MLMSPEAVEIDICPDPLPKAYVLPSITTGSWEVKSPLAVFTVIVRSASSDSAAVTSPLAVEMEASSGAFARAA